MRNNHEHYKAKPSLITIYGWNGTVSFDGFLMSIPTGLLFPGNHVMPKCEVLLKPKIKKVLNNVM